MFFPIARREDKVPVRKGCKYRSAKTSHTMLAAPFGTIKFFSSSL